MRNTPQGWFVALTDPTRLWTFICPRELPKEWESRAEEEELEISVEDLTEENYVPRRKAFHPFSGQGYRLGRYSKTLQL